MKKDLFLFYIIMTLFTSNITAASSKPLQPCLFCKGYYKGLNTHIKRMHRENHTKIENKKKQEKKNRKRKKDETKERKNRKIQASQALIKLKDSKLAITLQEAMIRHASEKNDTNRFLLEAAQKAYDTKQKELENELLRY